MTGYSAPEELKDKLHKQLSRFPAEPLSAIRPLLSEYPKDPDLLILASVAALIQERPDQSLSYQKRLSKYFVPTEETHLLQALAMAQKGFWLQAARILEQHKLTNGRYFSPGIAFAWEVQSWIRDWLNRITRENKKIALEQQREKKKREVRAKAAKAQNNTAKPETKKEALSTATNDAPPETAADFAPPLPVIDAQVPVAFTLLEREILLPAAEACGTDSQWFQLRSDFVRLNLFQGFDELLCLPLLRDITTYWYQVETVRKVLKQFRGRVLLADEVGLGKTIEAGMVLKEYMLRGMAQKILVLTPASMVGQWTEEMETKFDVQFASSYDSLVRSDAEKFWAQPRVIASIATARRAEHFDILRKQVYDLVIVDEAHHLKNRATNNWKLVDALQKRFLLLLSATPVQNSLVELYNLLTLLKPGIFKTEKEFRSTYMTSGKPRLPASPDRMRDLMREVMIRNTRAQVDVRLPSRSAVTMRLNAGEEEAGCYSKLSELIQQFHQQATSHHRLSMRHLLSAAGSSPAAAAAAIQRFIKANQVDDAWQELQHRYAAIEIGCKESALRDLLQRNADEKKMVFVHHRETLERLGALLETAGMPFERFDGSMSGLEKDRTIERFRDQTPLLLCTESGGEGRNLQFCNTMINFDLPWNPMAIEQRIGRLHRIGQRREVFIFNLVAQNTIEEYVLRILDEKINMFELVVGEIDSILGEMEESQEFAEMIFSAWVKTSELERDSAFDEIGERVVEAKRQYEAVKTLDENLFGDEFTTH